jgi:hypothetical protein
MGDRAVDCARLESVCAARHQGFESPPIRFLFYFTPARARNRNRNRGISADRACSLSVNPAATLRCVRAAPRRECLPRDK